MHPEIGENKPGRCPKCGMKLVKQEELSKTHHTTQNLNNYTPLIVVLSLIFLTSFAIASSNFSITRFISSFMIGFFIVFGGFKLMDIKGFAEGYSTYDLIAKTWFQYGYIYPFIELFFGFGMILNLVPTILLWLEVFVMTISGIGVLIKLLKKERFQCACLGTFLKVPLTKITIIEDFGMAALALLLLAIK